MLESRSRDILIFSTKANPRVKFGKDFGGFSGNSSRRTDGAVSARSHRVLFIKVVLKIM